MQYYAYAKINLRLEVIKKLPNGYHDLRMVNAKVSLKDILEITPSTINQVMYSEPELNHLKNDLCLNVLNELIQVYQIKERYKINIIKYIPQGAGLGGGSSDVAAIINFIDEQHNLNLPLEEKIKIGIKYGADVPYCLIDHLAFVSGIGENITILKSNLKNKKIVIVYPNLHILTKEVFANVTKYSTETKIETIKQYVATDNLDKLLYNELENATFELSSELKTLKQSLAKYGKVIMSGSGSTMLVFLNDDNKVSDLKKIYPNYFIEEVEVIT